MDELTVEEMADKIVKTCRGGTSFVELQKAIGPQSEGDLVIEYRPNLIVWARVSERFADACLQVIKDGRVKVTPTSPLIYMIDGVVPKCPVAKRLRAYKQPHWLPVVFNKENIMAKKKGGKKGGKGC